MDIRKTSKFLSLILRHKPQTIGVVLDENGWVDIDKLLIGMKIVGMGITREQLQEVVDTNDKKRFIIEDNRIRANQGHSVKVDLEYKVTKPPIILYHGTYKGAIESIKQHGLTKQKRHHVHLNRDPSLAFTVGKRRGIPVVLTIWAGDMAAFGHEFQVTPNNVWLTDWVPPDFIDFPED